MDANRLVNILTNEYYKLDSEFGFDSSAVKLRIDTWLKNLQYMCDLVYFNHVKTVRDLMDNIELDYQTYESSTMCSKYVMTSSQTVVQFIVVPYERIYQILAETKATDEEIEEYFKLCLRHEVGHILADTSAFNNYTTIQEAIEALNYSSYRAAIAYNKFAANLYELYEEDETISEYEFQRKLISRYYSCAPERLANRLAKVNTRRLIDLELKVRLGLTKR